MAPEHMRIGLAFATLGADGIARLPDRRPNLYNNSLGMGVAMFTRANTRIPMMLSQGVDDAICKTPDPSTKDFIMQQTMLR